VRLEALEGGGGGCGVDVEAVSMAWEKGWVRERG